MKKYNFDIISKQSTSLTDQELANRLYVVRDFKYEFLDAEGNIDNTKFTAYIIKLAVGSNEQPSEYQYLKQLDAYDLTKVINAIYATYKLNLENETCPYNIDIEYFLKNLNRLVKDNLKVYEAEKTDCAKKRLKGEDVICTMFLANAITQINDLITSVDKTKIHGIDKGAVTASDDLI